MRKKDEHFDVAGLLALIKLVDPSDILKELDSEATHDANEDNAAVCQGMQSNT